jgi:restriction endonuclease S subunit
VTLAIPAGLETRRLRFLFETKSGATPSSGVEEYWDGDINWVTPEDLGKLSDRYVRETRRRITVEGYKNCGVSLAPPGSIVLSKRAPIGQAAILDVPSTCNQGCFLLTRLDGVDERFYYYALIHLRPALEALGRGSTFMELSADDLRSVRMPFPSESSQHIAANYLDRETDRIDGLIAEKERMLALLEEKRTALISRVVTRGLDPDAPMQPSGQEWLGEIPAHWSAWRLKHLASEALSYGANEAALEDNPEWPRFVRITDIATDGSLRDETFKSLPPEVAEPFLLEDGDLLFARSGATVGKSFIYRPSWGIACFAGYLIRFRSDRNKVLPDFLNLYAQSSVYWHQVSTGTIQATIQNFSAEKYADIIVPLPPMSQQREIVEAMANKQARFDGLTLQIRDSVAVMKERRAALISAAVTGQIPLEEMTG